MSADDKLRLIEEVRKRPFLWNVQHHGVKRNLVRCATLWAEIGQALDMNANTCRNLWQRLRVHFCNEANRIAARIAKAKEKREYDPHKKYYTWAYFDALRFIADGRSSKAKFDLSFRNNSDSDIEIIENSETDSKHLPDSSSCIAGSDDDIEFIECNNSDHIQSENQKYFENHYESENDIEIVENTTLDQPESEREIFAQHNFLPAERDNTSAIIAVDDSDESRPENIDFKAYTISISNCAAQDSACNTILQSSSVFKEEPELQIEMENHPVENENTNELQDPKFSTLSAAEEGNCSNNSDIFMASNENEHYHPEDHISHSTEEENEYHGLPTFPEEQFTSSPGSSDEDYSFLYSFLSQTKVMTQLQKMEFRVNMKNLLVHIFPASASVNVLEKQLLLPEDNDPDRKFLISFWPFLKSMSLVQNLQFRAKVADLVLQILSSAAISQSNKTRKSKYCK